MLPDSQEAPPPTPPTTPPARSARNDCRRAAELRGTKAEVTRATLRLRSATLEASALLEVLGGTLIGSHHWSFDLQEPSKLFTLEP